MTIEGNLLIGDEFYCQSLTCVNLTPICGQLVGGSVTFRVLTINKPSTSEGRESTPCAANSPWTNMAASNIAGSSKSTSTIIHQPSKAINIHQPSPRGSTHPSHSPNHQPFQPSQPSQPSQPAARAHLGLGPHFIQQGVVPGSFGDVDQQVHAEGVR